MALRVTKRAKPVEVVDYVQTVESLMPEYTCPTCHTTFKGLYGLDRNVTRFICECGQELRIVKRTAVEEEVDG